MAREARESRAGGPAERGGPEERWTGISIPLPRRTSSQDGGSLDAPTGTCGSGLGFGERMGKVRSVSAMLVAQGIYGIPSFPLSPCASTQYVDPETVSSMRIKKPNICHGLCPWEKKEQGEKKAFLLFRAFLGSLVVLWVP